MTENIPIQLYTAFGIAYIAKQSVAEIDAQINSNTDIAFLMANIPAEEVEKSHDELNKKLLNLKSKLHKNYTNDFFKRTSVKVSGQNFSVPPLQIGGPTPSIPDLINGPRAKAVCNDLVAIAASLEATVDRLRQQESSLLDLLNHSGTDFFGRIFIIIILAFHQERLATVERQYARAVNVARREGCL